MTEIVRGNIASLEARAHQPGNTFGPWTILELIAEIRRRDAEIERLRSLDPFVGAIADFPLGTRVRKTKGSSWQGHIVGYYSTQLTPRGVAVESEREGGSVQIYPVAAMEELPN